MEGNKFQVLRNLSEEDQVATEMEMDTSTPPETSQGRDKHLDTRLQEVSAERTHGNFRNKGKGVEKVVYKAHTAKDSEKAAQSPITNIQTPAGSGLTPRAAPETAASQGIGRGKYNKASKPVAFLKPKMKPGTPGTFKGNQSGNFQRVMSGTSRGKPQPGTNRDINPGNLQNSQGKSQPQSTSSQPLSYAEAARRRIPQKPSQQEQGQGQRRRAKPVWRESEEKCSLIVSCAGIDMVAADLALFIEAKLQAVALKYDYKTSSFEVGMAEGTDLDKVIKTGLEWKGRIFAIEKPYAPQEEFFDLRLTGLPLISIDRLTQSIREALEGGDDILRITPKLCFGTSLHTGQFIVTVKGKPDSECGRPRYVTIEDREVFISWEGAAVICRTCRMEGHYQRACPQTQQSTGENGKQVPKLTVQNKVTLSPPKVTFQPFQPTKLSNAGLWASIWAETLKETGEELHLQDQRTLQPRIEGEDNSLTNKQAKRKGTTKLKPEAKRRSEKVTDDSTIIIVNSERATQPQVTADQLAVEQTQLQSSKQLGARPEDTEMQVEGEQQALAASIESAKEMTYNIDTTLLEDGSSIWDQPGVMAFEPELRHLSDIMPRTPQPQHKVEILLGRTRSATREMQL